MEDPENINLENLHNLQDKYNLKIDVSVISDNIVMYIITDNNSLINEIPIKFYFAVKS